MSERNYRLYIKQEGVESEKIVKFSALCDKEAKVIRDVVIESFNLIGAEVEVTLLWETYGWYTLGPMDRFDDLARYSERPLESSENAEEQVLTVFSYRIVN